MRRRHCERLTTSHFLPPWVRHEHQARYTFASKFVKDKVVVDCACGEGIGTEIFLSSGAKWVGGFDASSTAVASAKARCASWPNVQFQVCDGLSLPVASRFADLYVCLETIEHLSDDRSFLKEATRILKPEGLFLCSTPNRSVTNPGKSLWGSPWNRYHVREYSREDFLRLLHGFFGTVELYGQNPQRPHKVRLMGWLGNRLPGHGAVTIQQILKLPLFFWDNAQRHAVLAWKGNLEFEYLVALCQKMST